MNYKDIFNNLLLEASTPLPAQQREHDVPDDAMNNMLDDGTNPESFLTQGLKDTFASIQKHFDTEMTKFSESLSKPGVEELTLKELKKTVGKVFDFANRIEIYSKAKIDSMAQDPYAVMAGYVASDPTKAASFKDLHKSLQDFQQIFEDIDAQLASISDKIEDFISEATEPMDESDFEFPDGMDAGGEGMDGFDQQSSTEF